MTPRRVVISISATGEVSRERKIAKVVVARLKQQFSDIIDLETVEWDSDFPECNSLPDKADLALFIFGSRLPITNQKGKFECEFQSAVNAASSNGRPDILAYRSAAPVTWSNEVDFASRVRLQADQFKEFFEKWFYADGVFKAAYHPYSSLEEFEIALEMHLKVILRLQEEAQRRVFISYSSNDAEKASDIVKFIEDSGIRCWISSRDVKPGEEYQEKIVEALDNSRVMVLIFSHAVNDNPNEILRELSIASRQGLVVIPVRIENVEPARGLRYELANRQYFDIFEGGLEAMRNIIEAIKRNFGV